MKCKVRLSVYSLNSSSAIWTTETSVTVVWIGEVRLVRVILLLLSLDTPSFSPAFCQFALTVRERHYERKVFAQEKQHSDFGSLPFGNTFQNLQFIHLSQTQRHAKLIIVYLSRVLALESRWENGRTKLNSGGMVTTAFSRDPEAPLAWGVEWRTGN